MKKIKISTLIEFSSATIVFIILAAVTAVYDLQINKALYNINNFYGQYFANLGELPTFIAAPVAGTILFYQNFGKTKNSKLLFKLLFGAIVFIGCAALNYWLFGKFSPQLMYKYLYIFAFACISTFAFLFSCKFIPEDKMKRLFWFAIFIIVVAVITNVIIMFSKLLWARQRFRTMTPGDPHAPTNLAALGCADYNGFTPWYIINSIKNPGLRTEAYIKTFKALDSSAFQSFPSGHTSAASVSFSLIILPDIYKNLKKINWVFWLVPIIYTTLVAISRVTVGAHYLSDTLFGFYTGMCVAFISKVCFEKKIRNWETINQPKDEQLNLALEETNNTNNTAETV